MATMIRGMSLRETMIRPAMSYSRRLARRKRALCTSTTKTTPSTPVVSPPPRPPSTDITEAATTEGGNPTGGGPSSRKRMEWRPSEVHRASATSLRRKEVRSRRTLLFGLRCPSFCVAQPFHQPVPTAGTVLVVERCSVLTPQDVQPPAEHSWGGKASEMDSCLGQSCCDFPC